MATTTLPLAQIYDDQDEIHRLSMGETADFTCAYYDGDYTLSLEQAQEAKHA